MASGKKSIFYKYPLLYIYGLRWIHKGNLAKRYRHMAGFANAGDTVLEPGCGPAILANYLPKDCHYYGFDTNENFINYASKKCHNVHLGNVLDPKNYFKADLVVVCDTLHHLNPIDRESFIENCFLSAKKVFIICEPGGRSERADGILRSLKQQLAEWSEKDGTNDFKVEYFLTRNRLLSQIERGFDVIPPSVKRETKDFGEDIVAVFFKEEDAYQKAHKQKSVSAIVPAYNEEMTVAGVVEVLLKNSLINEVICINDGSTDKTLTILKSFGDKITLVDLQKNQGKGYALVEGIKKANSEIVTFIDADLTNLSNTNIETLLDPILNGKVRAVLGYPSDNGKLDIFTNLTGERAYYKTDLVSHLAKMAKARFGVEVLLNDLFDEKKTKKIPLKKLLGLCKYEKRGPVDAFKEYLGQIIEIAQEIGRREGLLPKDYQTIDKISKATNLKELKTRVGEITNKNVRNFLRKYVLKYMKAVRYWWKNPLP